MNNHSRIFVPVLLISLSMISSCGGRQNRHYTEEIVDGIRVITNSLIETEAGIRLVEEISIGEAEGNENYMFSAPRDIDADSQGNIYVLDYMESTIKKYDPDGKHLFNIGRLGEGPGEFENPRAMCIYPQDEIFVTELSSVNITRLDTEGNYLGTIEFGHMIDSFAVLDENSLIIGYKAYSQSGSQEPEFEYQLGRFDPSTKEFDVFYAEKQTRTARLSDGSCTLEYPNFVRWAVESGENIYAATGHKFEVSILSFSGDLMSKFGLDMDPTPVSGDVLKKANEILDRLAGLSVDFKSVRQLIRFYPMFHSIHCDETGRVWIQRYEPYWRDEPVEETVFDVFSGEGIFLHTVRIPRFITSDLVFKHGYLYVLASEEAGYSKAHRFQIIDRN